MTEVTRAKGVIAALAATALLSACVGGVDRGRPIRTAAPRPVIQHSDPGYRLCAARLDAAAIRYEALPNETKGGGCALINTIKLMDFGTPATNLGPMTCPLAANFTAWARYGVAPAARLYLGAEVVRIETFGTYACRNIVGNPNMAGKRSEHAHGNAIDVSGFVLSDGRRITVQDDWSQSGAIRQFLRTVHASACKRFSTVLGPDYNAAHYNHFHFDMGARGNRGGYCR
ncbi:MAG TPA: extensin family protein [Sphingobium sp.]|nr:extensin family protein [Sphingobium sp.]